MFTVCSEMMSTRLITTAFLISGMVLTLAIAISAGTLSPTFLCQWEMGIHIPASGGLCEDVSELIAGIWERNTNLLINPALVTFIFSHCK